jgi:hypothetical protein
MFPEPLVAPRLRHSDTPIEDRESAIKIKQSLAVGWMPRVAAWTRLSLGGQRGGRRFGWPGRQMRGA